MQPPDYPTMPSMPVIPPQPPRKKPLIRRKGCYIPLIIGVVLLASFIALAAYGSTLPPAPASANATPTSQPTQAAIVHPTTAPTTKPTAQPTAKPTAKPTTAPVSHYPPKTHADLQFLAAHGDASAIHEFHSESVGLTGVCPQPKREVTVDPSITGQQLAEDLLAYFYAQQLDNPCGSIVFAYHDQSEANDVYTAGRINFDANDASGQANTDPNATGLKYQLTLDTGGAITSQQEYVVNY